MPRPTPEQFRQLYPTLEYETPVEVAPGVRRVTQDNPGPFTGPGTNTHLVGHDAVLILDPGVDDERHFEAVVRAVGEARVEGVFVSHAHPDHWPLAPRLAQHFGAPSVGFEARSGFVPDRTIGDGDVLSAGGADLLALHTPGHASDHLCLVDRERRALFSGDHVMGWSTTIISPPDGNLNAYMASLERLFDLDFDVAYSAHGEAIPKGRARVRELHTHREERTQQALAAMRDGLQLVPEMVARIYADTPQHLHGAAAQSLWAHLDALVESGEVTRTDGPALEASYALARERR